jgi:hypothetical protein
VAGDGDDGLLLDRHDRIFVAVERPRLRRSPSGPARIWSPPGWKTYLPAMAHRERTARPRKNDRFTLEGRLRSGTEPQLIEERARVFPRPPTMLRSMTSASRRGHVSLPCAPGSRVRTADTHHHIVRTIQTITSGMELQRLLPAPNVATGNVLHECTASSA